MIRLLGVLVGSALAVAALVVFVGIPQFTTETSVSEQSVITLPMRPEPVPATDPPEPAPAEVAAADAEPPAGPVETAPEPSLTAADASAGPPPDAAGPRRPLPPDSQPPAESPSWYAFWSPFRSEIAANGFVDRLQSVTGLDYRVVKVETGVYEVAFAYTDDDEITPKLSQISAATGLDLAAN